MATDARRGRLTVWLGAAPGVGKTCAMLKRAQALRRAGVDVAIAVALTHGRAGTTALLDGLERLSSTGEFDLDAALARKPAVLVVDELAHGNPVGARHAKRWQDVEELLGAGIDVLTTLNVQHVESRRDVVARLTGVDVRERVPDAVLAAADAIELVDLPTAALLERLRAGQVYGGDGADRALAGFFTPTNLDGLRELALRLVAERVGAAAGIAPGRRPAERLLVAIGPSPSSAGLVRAAKRMADATGATWLAASAETPDSLRLSPADRARIAEHLRLAASLGAETATVSGADAPGALIDAANRSGVRRMIVGKPAHGRLRDLWRGSLVHDLIRRSGSLEVLAITGEAGEPAPPVTLSVAPSPLRAWAVAVVAVAAATAVALPLRAHLEPANLAIPFLFAVVATALAGRHGPTALATVLGVLAFDLSCVRPYWSFSVADAEYLLTFAGMAAVGAVVTGLVARLRAQADGALAQAAAAEGLRRLGAGLAANRGVDRLAHEAQARCAELLGCRVTVLVTDHPGSTALTAAAAALLGDERPDLPPADLAVAQWVATHGAAAGQGTTTLPGAAGLHLPLAASVGTIGVLALHGLDAVRAGDLAWRRAAEAAARLIALAIECDRLDVSARDARGAAEAERVRSTLLAGVSHDLCTPLTAIAGLANQLGGETEPADRRGLAAAIGTEAERLARLVRNLLDLTRLNSGTVRPRRVELAAEDAIAAAVAVVRPRLAGRPVAVRVADGCPVLCADETLLHTALVNLLDNAAAHAPGSDPLEIGAQVVTGGMEFTVADRGPGIAETDRVRLLEPFQRGAASSGTGLGLAIVRTIAVLHGGTLGLAARPGGGTIATMRFPETVRG